MMRHTARFRSLTASLLLFIVAFQPLNAFSGVFNYTPVGLATTSCGWSQKDPCPCANSGTLASDENSAVDLAGNEKSYCEMLRTSDELCSLEKQMIITLSILAAVCYSACIVEWTPGAFLGTAVIGACKYGTLMAGLKQLWDLKQLAIDNKEWATNTSGKVARGWGIVDSSVGGTLLTILGGKEIISGFSAGKPPGPAGGNSPGAGKPPGDSAGGGSSGGGTGGGGGGAGGGGGGDAGAGGGGGGGGAGSPGGDAGGGGGGGAPAGGEGPPSPDAPAPDAPAPDAPTPEGAGGPPGETAPKPPETKPEPPKDPKKPEQKKGGMSCTTAHVNTAMALIKSINLGLINRSSEQISTEWIPSIRQGAPISCADRAALANTRSKKQDAPPPTRASAGLNNDNATDSGRSLSAESGGGLEAFVQKGIDSGQFAQSAATASEGRLKPEDVQNLFKDFKKLTGVDPVKFGADVLKNGPGSTLSKFAESVGGATAAAEAIQNMDMGLQKIAKSVSPTQFASAEAASRSKAKGGPDFANLFGSKGAGATGPGVSEVRFGGFEGDIWHAGTTKSIFEIVSDRTRRSYQRVGN